jgi:hypothetical protein
MAPYVNGGKLAGAGGGGFAILVAHDRQAAADLATTLQRVYPGTPVAAWPCAVPEAGMVIKVGDERGNRPGSETC